MFHSVLSQADAEELRAVRRAIHANPELGFNEHSTAALVVEQLQLAGVDEIHTGIAGTGVVGVIRRGSSSRSIGIRADMDALPLTETSGAPYASKAPGVMHACGHDGHTAILLGAARVLTKASFNGTVYLIFQPAEEGLGGAKRMVDDGLFERFPMERVFGLHNWPGLARGRFAIKPGSMMASVDRFDIEIVGSGGHAARPQDGVDPIVAGSLVVATLQTIVSRFSAPEDSAVVSITEFSAGNSYNIIPTAAVLRGTVRTVTPEDRDKVEGLVRRMVAGVCEAQGATYAIDYRRGTPPTINHGAETDILRQAAIDIVGRDNVEDRVHSSLAGEDFATLLERRPGAYIFLGNGEGGPSLHNPKYDFADDTLPLGVALWARLISNCLGG